MTTVALIEPESLPAEGAIKVTNEHFLQDWSMAIGGGNISNILKSSRT